MSGTEVFLAGLPGSDDRRGYKHEARAMQPVRKIVVKGAVDLYFRRFGTPHLVVAGETEEALRCVKTTIKGDKLVVESEGVGVQINSAHGSVSIGSVSGSIFVNGQRIDVGGGRVVVGVALPELPALKIKGSGDVSLMDLRQAGLEIEIEGSGDVTADGQVEQLDVSIAGSGDLDARELIAQRGSLSIAGSGDISAHVSHEVVARIAGSGDIVVRGNPASRSKQVLGSGSVKFK
ncbi:GIN domain-containing protein [Paucibacter soli]|uniref:GIN domain-containing protein n=1 Tax=Paucibacter soli TaxID=3133433 RepID=UPI0030B510E0